MVSCIMHVDIDAFFASVEQLRNPHLRGRPVAIGSGVIASCSYEARRFGLRAGMPLHTARKRCPRVIVLEGHYPTYRCFADRVFDLCRQVAPNIETYLDDVYCDLTGTETLYGPPAETGRRLKELIRKETGLAVTVGIGSNRTIARIASHLAKPDGLRVVAPGAEEEFLRDLPVKTLPGVGHATHEILQRLNVKTVADLQRMPRESLQALFGANGLALYERCHGRDARTVSEKEIPRSISRESAFHCDTMDPREIQGMLYYLVERAARTLRQLGLAAARIQTRIRYSDSVDEAAGAALPRGTILDREIFEAALDLLTRLYRRRVRLHLVGVTLSNFSLAGPHQMSLFGEKETVKLESLSCCLDELRQRFGHSIVIAGRSLELLGKLRHDSHGYILRTACLTK
jgi:DNA polymerase-4